VLLKFVVSTVLAAAAKSWGRILSLKNGTTEGKVKVADKATIAERVPKDLERLTDLGENLTEHPL
jgi:hypothetical protein